VVTCRRQGVLHAAAQQQQQQRGSGLEQQGMAGGGRQGLGSAPPQLLLVRFHVLHERQHYLLQRGRPAVEAIGLQMRVCCWVPAVAGCRQLRSHVAFGTADKQVVQPECRHDRSARRQKVNPCRVAVRF
jgi:hypothetical protein